MNLGMGGGGSYTNLQSSRVETTRTITNNAMNLGNASNAVNTVNTVIKSIPVSTTILPPVQTITTTQPIIV
jgi:hypothetical protein